MNDADLMAFFNATPSLRDEYGRHMAQARGTDQRSPAQWLRDAIGDPNNPGLGGEFQRFMGGQSTSTQTPTQTGTTTTGNSALDRARAAYRAMPDSMPNYSDDGFAQWWAQNHGSYDISQYPEDFALLTALADSGNQTALQALDTAGYEQGAETEALPVEQGILQTALPGLIADVEADERRRTLADELAAQTRTDYEAARTALSPEENARRLLEEYAMADTTANALSSSAATSAQAQLQALQQSIASMQGNLTGALATKAKALQDQVATLNANLDKLDATQREALAKQIAAQQQDLQESITAQREALQQQLTTLRGGVDEQTQARRTALQQELASLQGVNTAQAEARRQALQQEIASLQSTAATQNQARVQALQSELESLRGATGAQADSRRAALQEELTSLRSAATTQNDSRVQALQKEIEGLIAAQAPMAQARLDSANALSSAINLGFESTKDQLTATRAKQGYLGSSSFDNAALARAAIGARQNAAQTMGQARELNADDLRQIQARAATEGRSLADELSGNLAAISTRGATEGRGISEELARNLYGINTTGAAERRTLADELASNLAAISTRGATEGRSIADQLAAAQRDVGVYGANNARSIAEADAAAKFGITQQGAEGYKTLADLLAEGTRQLKDTGATGEAALTNQTAQNRYNIGAYGANQGYADVTAGAGEYRRLADLLAKGGGDIGTLLAQQQQEARDKGALAKQGYFDNAYTRGQASLLARPTLGSQMTQTLTGLENYRNTGLQRTLDALNWWATNTQAPTPSYVPVQADNSGNDLSSLGSSLLGSALQYGNANNWWQTPKTQQIPNTSILPASTVGSNLWGSNGMMA